MVPCQGGPPSRARRRVAPEGAGRTALLVYLHFLPDRLGQVHFKDVRQADQVLEHICQFRFDRGPGGGVLHDAVTY